MTLSRSSRPGDPAPIPRIDRWPRTVQSAERLRGTLVSCGPGARLVAWPDTARVRAQALAPWLTPQRIAALLTAAWVWDAAAGAGAPLRFAMRDGRRAPRSDSPEYRLHEFQLAPGDVLLFGEFAVTSPARTVFDLLRSPDDFDLASRVACRLLFARHAGLSEAVRERLVDGGRPYRALALARLETCGS